MSLKTPLEDIALKKAVEVAWLTLAFFIPNAVWYSCFHAGSPFGNVAGFFFSNCVSCLPYVTLFLLAFRFLPRSLALLLLGCVMLALSVASWIGISHYLIFHYPINETSIYIALNTNLSEAREFITTYENGSIFGILAGLLCFQAFLFRLFCRKNLIGAGHRKTTVVVALILLQPSWAVVAARSNALAPDNLVSVYREVRGKYRSDLAALRSCKAEVAAAREAYQVRTLPHQVATKETYILVIGESTSRRHMGIYGYRRDTTPCLERLSGEMFRFDDVVSPHSHTIPVLQKVLTVRNGSVSNGRGTGAILTGKEFFSYPNLLGIMKRGGFRTFWLSNQTVLGEYDLWNTFFSESADRRVFTNTDGKGNLDEALLPALKAALADPSPKKVIVLHLMGAHLNAGDPFPRSFAKFSDPGIPAGAGSGLPTRSTRTRDYVNRYDDAIRYGDSLLESVLRQLKAQSGMRLLVFLSDHGEEVGEKDEFVGHTETRGSHYMFEIPFLVWGSPEYLAARPEIARELPGALLRPYQTDDFMHTFMDMAGVWTDGYQPEKSVVNSRFVPRRRVVCGIDYEQMRRQKP
jgi:heptose-I-phosphate ethanolaminephosphotransferase